MNDMISRSALLEEWNKLSARGRTEFDQVIMMQPSVEPVRGEWIDVKDALPPEKEHWKEYIVCVERSHYPTSTYDIIDSPYSETIITTAKYDSQQKIWHLQWDEQLNALMDIDDSPLNGDYITHWMPLPKL